MTGTRALPSLLFRAVCLSFSALLLTLSLFWQIRAIGREEEAAQTQTRIEELTEERNRLQIARAQSPSLAELEEYARRELGMQHPARGQIVTIPKMG